MVNTSVRMIPSPGGTFIARAFFLENQNSICQISFLDSTGLEVIAITDEFQAYSYWPLRWQSDSILGIIDMSTYPNDLKIVGPFMKLQDSDAPPYRFPATSSSVWNRENGYITFNGTDESITITDSIPLYEAEWWSE